MGMIASQDDIAFKDRFEAGDVAPSDFHHREHLRLAFVYLCESDVNTANMRMRHAIKTFLMRNNVPAGKYHETLTSSWVQAVRHFMKRAQTASSFDGFLSVDGRLLDTGIMLSHYTKETLFSEKARFAFVEPDIQQIPQYA